MPTLLSDLTRAAAPHVVDICLVAIVMVYLALMVVLVAAAITALVHLPSALVITTSVGLVSATQQ